MNIGIVTRHVFPTDQEIRITKIASSLYEKGHKVVVFCPSSRASERYDTFAYGSIVRLTSKWLPRLVMSPLPLNPIWVFWLRWHVAASTIDVLIVRDLRLAVPAVVVARMHGIKMILDLGEHYPGMMQVVGRQHWTHYVTRNAYLISKLERVSVRLADKVWVVVEENKERLGRYGSAIEVVHNYPIPQADHSLWVQEVRPYSANGEPLTLVSLGIIDNIRGLELGIQALALLLKDLENVRLLIYGDGFFRAALEERVRALGVQDKVFFPGWVAGEDKYTILSACDVGLLLHKVCDLTDHTLPNKLFDYMSVGLPVVTTPLRPVVRIVSSADCGVVVQENPRDVADTLKGLLLDLDGRARLGENGRNAVRERFVWTSEAAKVVRDVEAFEVD